MSARRGPWVAWLIRLALTLLAALLVLAAPARATTQPFGGLTQFPGTLGCISEDGSDGRCADGVGPAGVTAVTAAPVLFSDAAPLLYAASPSRGTVSVLAVDPKDGGFQQTGCFSATPRAGCTTVPALAGATDIAADGSGRVAVAARDADAVVLFRRSDRTLVPVAGPAGCVARALAGCTPAAAFDAPVAVAFAGTRLIVAARASNAVSQFTLGAGSLTRDGCIEQGAAPADGCAPGGALASPEDLAAYAGDLYGFRPPPSVAVASSGSGGVALLDLGDDGPHQRDVPGGCVTEGGAGGCTAGTGLAGAARVVAAQSDLYVAAPGAGRVTRLGGGSVEAPTTALATPPAPERLPADAGSWAGSHLYAGGAGIAVFRRDDRSGALAGLAGPSLSPAGGVAGLAVSGDTESLAVYAAVPAADALLAFARNIPPSCPGHGFAGPAAPVTVTAPAADIPLGCTDPNGDPLSYTVVTPPRLGRVIGFADGAALYRGPLVKAAKATDSFTVRASDGAESDTRTVEVQLDYDATPKPKAKTIARPSFRFLDRSVPVDRRGRISLRVRCTVHSGSRCRVALAAHRRGTARRTVTLRSGRRTRVRIRLTRATRRAVRRAHRNGVVVTVTARARDAGGRATTAKRRIRVRAKR